MIQNTSWKRWVLLGLVGGVSAAGWTDSPIQWRGSRGWEADSAYCRLYDPKALVKLRGTVERVDQVVPMKGMGAGVYLALKTDAESIPVHLGPQWYVEKQPVHFHAGDAVAVTGSRILCDGKPAILAATVQRGDDTAKYRELNGRPAWSGQAH